MKQTLNHLALHVARGADNGNKSAVHWHLVLIQTPEWGGGEIWFGGLARKDGLLVLPDLEALNPGKSRV